MPKAENKRSLDHIVEALAANSNLVCDIQARPRCAQPLPARDAIIDIVESLRSTLFPGYFGLSELTDESRHFHIGATLDRVRRALTKQIQRCQCFECKTEGVVSQCQLRASETCDAFLQRLPEVQRLLRGDVDAAYEGDPALTTADEAIFCYPGLQAITSQRLAHELHKLKIPLMPRIITEHAHSVTGIDIHPGAQIGERLFIDHGTGVVVGETCVIGNNVRIYQGVTLGAKSFPLDEHGNPIKGIARHPIVEDDVVIYSGATILGRITLGKASVIGGNVWLTRSLSPGSRVAQVQARQEVYRDGLGI